jgi:AcrR family transcriptional regulator
MEYPMPDADETATKTRIQLDGVTPALQARSQATFNALIQAGRRVMGAKEFEAVRISEIARTAGASVGAFYGRFANKEVFFSAIQEITVSDIEAGMRALLAQPSVEKAVASEFLFAIARFWVGFYRTHRGLYLASFKHSRTRPSSWTPFKRLGRNLVSLVIKQLAPRLRQLDRARSEREIRIAFQFVNGLLVNAVVNDPGPMSLDDAEMERSVARFLCAYFGIQAPTATKKRRLGPGKARPSQRR